MKLRTSLLVFAVLALAGLPVMAQNAPKDPLSSSVRNGFKAIEKNLIGAAEKMPEENYGMRPGPQTEVRTFGQIIGHVANANYLFCARGKGEADPHTTDYEKAASKADLVKGLKDSLAYCDSAYDSLTDASAMEMVSFPGANGQTGHALRVAPLITNVAHNNEHYGNLVTYLRIKSIVPPSSEPRPAGR